MSNSVNIFDDQPRHKKKSQKKTPKKADHEHDFQPCIFEYNGISFSRERGFTPKPEAHFGSYCSKCGKVNHSFDERWLVWVPSHKGDKSGRSIYTPEAEREINPETRTLPTFWLDDFWHQKFVEAKDFADVQGRARW